MLTIVCQNVKGADFKWPAQVRERLGRLAREIYVHQPTICLFQEVLTNRQQLALGQALPESLLISAGRRFWFFKRAGLVTAFTKDWSVADCQFVPFSRQGLFTDPLSWSDRFINKGFMALTIERDDQTLTMVNTHTLGAYGLDANGEQGVIDAQLAELDEFVSKLSGPVLVGGDLNCTADKLSGAYYLRRKMTEAFDYSETVVTVDPNNSYRTGQKLFRKRTKEAKRYTYLMGRGVDFTGRRIVLNELVDGKHLSDHYGLLAQAKFSTPSRPGKTPT